MRRCKAIMYRAHYACPMLAYLSKQEMTLARALLQLFATLANGSAVTMHAKAY